MLTRADFFEKHSIYFQKKDAQIFGFKYVIKIFYQITDVISSISGILYLVDW